VDPALLARAVHYLFTKETKSSFAIEGEVPSTDRTMRFVAALGRADNFDTGNKQVFVELQNSIVDPRYAQKDWRTIQNYVGQTASNYTEIVHFICPKPEDVASLMDGWMRMVARIEEGAIDAICATAVTGFGFVFVHPFKDWKWPYSPLTDSSQPGQIEVRSSGNPLSCFGSHASRSKSL
jgi:hypothetical protein